MAEMQYRQLGKSGLQVSVVGLGTNNFGRRLDKEATARVVHAALDCGITLLDTADVYGNGLSEEYIGAALQGRRDQAVIATKFGGSMGEGVYQRGGSRRWIMQAVEASLRRLQTDYIDLYQIHWYDPQTPVEETLSALNDLVHQGKVRYLGCSNFAGWQIADATWVAREHHLTPFVSAQNRYSLVDREIEREIIPACQYFGLGMLPYFPLASGLLTGKYHRGQAAPEGSRLAGSPSAERFLSEANFDVAEGLERWAREHGVTLLGVAFGALAAQPTVASVIAGATKPEQVQANAQAGTWTPTREELAEIDQIAPSLLPER